jgi:hypothetical protein
VTSDKRQRTKHESAVMENNSQFDRFRKFLQYEIAVTNAELATIERQKHQDDPLPMLLWQYGFVSLEQLQRIWNWLETQTLSDFS